MFDEPFELYDPCESIERSFEEGDFWRASVSTGFDPQAEKQVRLFSKKDANQVAIKAITSKAVLFCLNEKTCWIPRSDLWYGVGLWTGNKRLTKEELKKVDPARFTIPRWLYRRKASESGRNYKNVFHDEI